MQRRGEIDRLGLGDAPTPFETRDVAADAGDGGAQRLVAVDAIALRRVPRCAVPLGDALELPAVLEHRLFARRFAAQQSCFGVG